MDTIRVAVQGAYGKTGLEIVKAICQEDGFEAVGTVSRRAGRGSKYRLQDGSGNIPASNSLEEVIGDAQVVVDFTNAEGAMDAMRIASPRGANVVTGSTGLTQANLLEAERLGERAQDEHHSCSELRVWSCLANPPRAGGVTLLRPCRPGRGPPRGES